MCCSNIYSFKHCIYNPLEYFAPLPLGNYNKPLAIFLPANGIGSWVNSHGNEKLGGVVDVRIESGKKKYLGQLGV